MTVMFGRISNVPAEVAESVDVPPILFVTVPLAPKPVPSPFGTSVTVNVVVLGVVATVPLVTLQADLE